MVAVSPLKSKLLSGALTRFVRAVFTFQRRRARALGLAVTRARTSDVLAKVARGVVEVLGFGIAAIARLEGETLVMTTVAGPEDVREQIADNLVRAGLS